MTHSKTQFYEDNRFAGSYRHRNRGFVQTQLYTDNSRAVTEPEDMLFDTVQPHYTFPICTTRMLGLKKWPIKKYNLPTVILGSMLFAVKLHKPNGLGADRAYKIIDRNDIRSLAEIRKIRNLILHEGGVGKIENYIDQELLRITKKIEEREEES